MARVEMERTGSDAAGVAMSAQMSKLKG